MDLENRVRILENAYAGALADSVRCLNKEGLLEKVTEWKKKEQLAAGKQQADMLGIHEPKEVFKRLPEVFNCALWEIREEENGFMAEANMCKLCALAKRSGAGIPCHIYCLNPMEAMIKGLDGNSKFEVIETLWDGAKCAVRIY